MASGKSTIGKLLARALNLPLIDLDDYISKAEQLTIPEIFSTKGEIYFRKIESHYLSEVISKNEDFILSLGGGTPCYGNNLELILNTTSCHSFYLKASISTITNRIVKAKHRRPLVSHLKDEEIPEFIGKHLFERQFYYLQAHHIITVDDKSKKEVIQEIKAKLD